MMMLEITNALIIEINPQLGELPKCLICDHKVDMFLRKIDIDHMCGIQLSEDLIKSHSYNSVYVVRCHGEEGTLRLEF